MDLQNQNYQKATHLFFKYLITEKYKSNNDMKEVKKIRG